MNPNTGEIFYFETDQDLIDHQEKFQEKLMKLTKEQADMLEPLEPKVRKNLMRNHMCPCGSNKKLKNCCIDEY